MAELNTNLTSTASLSAEMKTYYDKNLIDEAEPYLVHDQFGQKRPIPKGNGKTIEFRRFASLPKSTGVLQEGVTPDGGTMSVSAEEATVGQYGYYVALSDVLQMTTIDPILVETTKALGSQSGRTLDTITRDILQGGTNVFYASKVSGSTTTEVTSRKEIDGNCKITVDDVEQMATFLKSNNAPKINGSYVAIVHPHVVYDLRRDPEFIEWHKYAQPEELFNGEVGKLANVRFVESTEAKIYYGANLGGTTRNLAVNNASGYTSATTIAFDGATVAEGALVDREILIENTVSDVTTIYHCKIRSNTASAITIDTTSTGYDHAITCADNAVIYPGEGGYRGAPVYGTLVLGENAYGVTEIEGGGLQTIIKPLGAGEDPLNQRSTAGWKAIKTAHILQQPYLIRFESGSAFGKRVTAAN